MDISILNNSSIKIRLRHSSFIVDPSAHSGSPGSKTEGSKISADAIILLDIQNNPLSKAVDYRVIINGPGEYEISRAKVTGVKVDRRLVYYLLFDGLAIIMGRTSDISKIKDDAYSCQVAILNVDDEFSSSIVTKLEPKIVILYGDNKESAAKLLGKENLLPIRKFTITKDKLPEEREVVVLG